MSYDIYLHGVQHVTAANGRCRFIHRGRGDGSVMFLSQVLEAPGGQCQAAVATVLVVCNHMAMVTLLAQKGEIFN